MWLRLKTCSRYVPYRVFCVSPPAQGLDRTVLTVLVKLLDDTSLTDDVPAALADLTEDALLLQEAATDADAVTRLARFVLEPSPHKEGALRAIGVLCMPGNREDGRKQLLDAKLLPPITRSLQV